MINKRIIYNTLCNHLLHYTYFYNVIVVSVKASVLLCKAIVIFSVSLFHCVTGGKVPLSLVDFVNFMYQHACGVQLSQEIIG